MGDGHCRTILTKTFLAECKHKWGEQEEAMHLMATAIDGFDKLGEIRAFYAFILCIRLHESAGRMIVTPETGYGTAIRRRPQISKQPLSRPQWREGL